MCSTFKWMLTALVLSKIERHELRLDQRIHYSSADLLDYAPVTQAHVSQGWLPVEDLCAAAVAVSDNTAANLLLALVGGPQGLTAFMRAHGDEITRLDRIEPDLNENAVGDERDTTTPKAMVRSIQALLIGSGLAPSSRDRIVKWMEGSTRGLDRLRAGLPAFWRAGNKPGTGANGSYNDVVIAWPPTRAPILIACYISGGQATSSERSAAHVDVASYVSSLWRSQ